MFFLDSTGFFSLICLFVQGLTAWIFAAFFLVMSPANGRWVRSWSGAFLGLGIGFTALGVRFSLAHHAVAGVVALQEGAAQVRALYATYLAGKVLFAWCLLAGVASLRGARWPTSLRLPLGCVAAGAVAGAALPTAESLLLVQATWMPVAFLHAARLLRPRPGDESEMGRAVVQRVLIVWSVIWLLYGICVLVVGPIHPAGQGAAAMLLRLNALIDVGLQVTLATSLIVVVMSEAQRTKVEALRERDRLREQVQRDEKFRALSTVVGGVAHEINNPLTAILGHAEGLAAADPATREQAAQIVREQADRCLGIVQRMSLLGRGAAVIAGEVDVVELAGRIAREFEPRMQAAGVELRLELVRPSRAFQADPTGVEQVLVNLVGNALHASPRGQIVTLVVAEYTDGVRFEVIDHGSGVPHADRTRIFEPFWTTRQGGAGRGLGLAVVDAIVRSHGGRVEVGTVRGGGAHFTVYWPYGPNAEAPSRRAAPAPAPAAVAASVPVPPPAPRAEPAARPPGGSRLLVIDDEPLVRRTIVRQAQAEGWHVTEAESGERGLELLLHPAAAFDAVVCDVRMPGVSGVGVHDTLAQRDPRWLRRLVFITGDMASTDAAQFASRCTAPIVEKPFRAADLMRRVRDVGQSA